MAGDDMPAQLVPNLQRPFQIDPSSGGELAGGGAGKRFSRNIDCKLVIALVDHRQADPRTGNRGAHIDAAHVIAAFDFDAQVTTLIERFYRADI